MKAKPNIRKGPVCFSRALEVEAPAQANGNSMTLRGVRIVEEGEAKGHGVWLDEGFVRAVVQLAEGRRIKCRFGHPGACKESFGTVLGYYDNFSVAQDDNGFYAIADLHLFNAANLSPNGRMADYVKELATEAPDMFGNSIVFSGGSDYRKTDKGINIYQHYGHNGDSTYVTDDGTPYDEAEHGKIDESRWYTNIDSLYQSDMVDEPAATSSVFSEPTLLGRIAEVFGLDFGGMRKTVLLRKIINELTYNMKKFDINATTGDGTAIVVVTNNDYIGVGDTVTDSEGTAAPDGQHDIAESDSNQSGITITVQDGTITRIEPTPTETSDPAGGDEGLSAIRKHINQLTADVEVLRERLRELAEQDKVSQQKVDALSERVSNVEREPATERKSLYQKDLKDKRSKAVPDWQQQLNEEYEKRFGA